MTTHFIFFSGKGGVGKTSMACVSAVRYADEGKRTLIVTTDPASNLADVFEQPLGPQINSVQGVPNLWAMEIDPDRATQEYKDRALAPIRAAFPSQIVQVMEEQMAGPCTTEVAAFDRFTDFLDPPDQDGSSYDVVIFDTAPTGHTLRLLELPFEWSHSIETASQGSGQTCIGPAAAIQSSKIKYEHAVTVMRDPVLATFIFVLQPEAIAIRETKRAISELEKLEIHTTQIIINSIIPSSETANPLFAARAELQTGFLKQIEEELPFTARRMNLLSEEIKGLRRLREVGELFFEGKQPFKQSKSDIPIHAPEMSYQPSAEILKRLMPADHGCRTLFFAGKGGVGKTVASCITAVWLAEHGYRTLLVTTDPAAHIGDVLDVPVKDSITAVPGLKTLWAAEIDPKAAAEIYRGRILEDARQRGRSPEAIKVMAEELDSPCTEEMAAFDQFIEYASQSDWQAIVFDTAPTGHTLRLLELPVDWSQQLDVKIFASVDTVKADDVAKKRFGKVIEMMRDPDLSTFAFVMYPEATPVLEAYRAAVELRKVGIEPGLVVANLVIPPEVVTTPFVQARRTMQEKYMTEITERFSVPVVQIPLQPSEIKGLKALSDLGKKVYGESRVASEKLINLLAEVN
jgi:arsenite/tail-anchored protein-transporting ATPase